MYPVEHPLETLLKKKGISSSGGNTKLFWL